MFLEVTRPYSIACCWYHRWGSQMGNKSGDLYNKLHFLPHNNSMRDIVPAHAKHSSRCYLLDSRSENYTLLDPALVKEVDLDSSLLGKKEAYLYHRPLVNFHYYEAYAYTHPFPSLFPMSSSKSSNQHHLLNHILQQVQHGPKMLNMGQ